MSGSIRPTDTTVRVSGPARLLRGAHAVVDNVNLLALDPKPLLPECVRVRDGRDHVGAGVGRAGQAAGQSGRSEAGTGGAPVADCRQIGLPHVDAVLGKHHRCSVDRLVHECGDRGPAGGRDVQDVGRGRRNGGGAGDPVQRLEERRSLEQIHAGGRAGLLHALVQHIPQGSQEGGPAVFGLERAAHADRGSATAHESSDEGLRVAVPAHELADENGRQVIRTGLTRTPAPSRQLLGPQLDQTDLAGVRG